MVRALENRCHNSSSVARSSRGSAFHSSSSSRNRLTPPRQSLPAASFSASTTWRTLVALVSSLCLARSALRAARCSATIATSASSRALSPSRSPTAWASARAPRTVRIEDTASSGDSAPDLTRLSSRETSSSRFSYRRVKNASASSAGTSGTCPTLRSPSDVRTYTVPSGSTRPKEAGPAASLIGPILPDSLARVFIASFPAGPWQTNCYVVATASGRSA